jgi:hypothetical protein
MLTVWILRSLGFLLRLPCCVLFRQAAVNRAILHAEDAVTMMDLERAEFIPAIKPDFRDRSWEESFAPDRVRRLPHIEWANGVVAGIPVIRHGSSPPNINDLYIY